MADEDQSQYDGEGDAMAYRDEEMKTLQGRISALTAERDSQSDCVQKQVMLYRKLEAERDALKAQLAEAQEERRKEYELRSGQILELRLKLAAWREAGRMLVNHTTLHDRCDEADGIRPQDKHGRTCCRDIITCEIAPLLSGKEPAEPERHRQSESALASTPGSAQRCPTCENTLRNGVWADCDKCPATCQFKFSAGHCGKLCTHPWHDADPNCQTCHGYGQVMEGEEPQPCECTQRTEKPSDGGKAKCETCGGSGRDNEGRRTCPSCHGTGQAPKKEG